MKKKILALTMLAVALVGCNNEAKNEKKVVLTEYEKKIANGNTNVMAELLIRNAVLEEMKDVKFTPEQKEGMEFAKESAAVDYYLKNNVIKPVQVSKEEIETVYNENKKLFGEQKLEDVSAQISNLIVAQKQNQELMNYYNELVKKYDLNESLKLEFPKGEDTKENKAK